MLRSLHFVKWLRLFHVIWFTIWILPYYFNCIVKRDSSKNKNSLLLVQTSTNRWDYWAKFGACGGLSDHRMIIKYYFNILKNQSSTNDNFYSTNGSTNDWDCFGDVLHWVGGQLHGTVTFPDLIPFFLLYPLSDFIIILKHDRPVIWCLLETEKIHICYITTGGKLYLKLKMIICISR